MFSGANVSKREIVVFYGKIPSSVMPRDGSCHPASVLIGRKCDKPDMYWFTPRVINENTQYSCLVLPENVKISRDNLQKIY